MWRLVPGQCAPDRHCRNRRPRPGVTARGGAAHLPRQKGRRIMTDSHQRLTITRRTALAGALGTAALAAAGPARAPGRGPQAERALHHGRRPRVRRPQLLRPARLRDAGARRPRRRRHDVHARLRQQRGVHGDARGPDHRALPVSPAAGPAGAARHRRRRPALVGRAAEHAFADARCGLRDHADRQMAHGQPAEVRPAQERLRRVLGALRRRGRLFHPRLRRPSGLVGRRNPDRGRRLHHRPSGRRDDPHARAAQGRTASRSSSACTSPRRTGRGKPTTKKAAPRASGSPRRRAKAAAASCTTTAARWRLTPG